jgi:hypothetical protein
LLLQFKNFRNSLASDTRHPLYRAQSERWMQVNVLEDVSRIDPMLDPNHVYEQVFAQTAGCHGILDLLCVTRARRLAILELKATENIDLPLQAADYWPHSPPSGARRHRSPRLFSWHRTSTRSADCVYHRPRSPISSDNRFAAPPHHARDGNRANWALGKLAPGHPR